VTRGGIGSQDVVVEIGAGLGALTVALAKTARKVYAIETDHGLIGLLQTQLEAAQVDNVTVLCQDALTLHWQGLPEAGRVPLVVAGNLPYHIASRIIVDLIDHRRLVRQAVVMVQKEMARRLTASPGNKDYGRLSVMLQYCSQVEKIADLGAGQFYPRPKIDSQVVRIRFRPTIEPRALCETTLSRVVQAAFAQRRKTLKNALAGSHLGLDPPRAEQLLASVGIDAGRRAETLTVAQFVRLSNAYGELETLTGTLNLF
jgi:16S rRNA (adenine1518-N6/adenine1519-N6)-dimethyltransferase